MQADPNTTNALTATCYHCGDNAGAQPILFDQKTFCCDGCRTVYRILNENNLCEYYKLEERNNLKGREEQNVRFYDFLDDEKVSVRLGHRQPDGLIKVEFFAPAMHCASCIWLLENLQKINPGIRSSRVDFVLKRIEIVFNPEKTQLSKIAGLLDRLGYAPDFSQNAEQKQNRNEQRLLIRKIAVAGFCFGNIMLFSMPAYFGFDKFAGNFPQVFNWLNILFTIPVFLYSGWGYTRSAMAGIRAGNLNLDVPLALGIWVMLIRSLVEIGAGVGHGYLDTLAGLVFFLLLGKYFQQRTHQALAFDRDYKSFFPMTAMRLEEEKFKPVSLEEIEPGNRLLIRSNELIPADSILMRGDAVVDYSFVTGESEPVNLVVGEMLYAGGRQAGAAIEVEVLRNVSQSYLTGLWNNDIFKVQYKSRVQTFTQVISRHFTAVLLIIALSTLLFWGISGNWARGMAALSAVLIIACPCALALSTPFTMGNVLRVFGKMGFYLKNSESVEQMAACNTFVFDKTGTLTDAIENAEVHYTAALDEKDYMAIGSVASQSVHPLSRRISKEIQWGQEVLQIESFREIPGKGLSGIYKGEEVRIGSADWVGIAGGTVSSGSGVFYRIGERSAGFISIMQKMRDRAGEVLRTFAAWGKVIILSGDSDRDRQRLLDIVTPADCDMYFRQSPEDKMNFIEGLQKDKKVKVMMLGDGLNDSGALKKADFGVAVTEHISHFSPGSDAILAAESFSRLPDFMRFSRKSIRVIHASFVFSLMYNIIGLSFAVQGTLSPLIAAILMPISSVYVIVFTTFSIRRLSARYFPENKIIGKQTWK